MITTCSKHNFNMVKRLGADHAIDYHSPTCVQDIKAAAGDSLSFVLDPITTAQTTRACFDCVGSPGGIYVALEMFRQEYCTRKDVRASFVMGASIRGRQINLDLGYGVPASESRRKFGLGWYGTFQKLVDQGRLEHHPTRCLPDGLSSVLKGLSELEAGRISGEKLVVRMAYDNTEQ